MRTPCLIRIAGGRGPATHGRASLTGRAAGQSAPAGVRRVYRRPLARPIAFRVIGHFITGHSWPLQNQPPGGWLGDRIG
jgi:hypothetical protein